MQITLDTNNISEQDRQFLALLIGAEAAGTEREPAPKKPVAKKPVAKKPVAKKPEPEPEPAAEEPLPDEEPEAEEPEVEEAEDVSDEDLLDLAIKKATEMVAGGDAVKVREALDAAGANRVRELNKDNVHEFFKALS